jgi:hypothetical protein
MFSNQEKMAVVTATLQKYEDRFNELIGGSCLFYKLLGNGTTESPMWFQLRAEPDKLERESLYFANSQKPGLSFSIPLEEDDQWVLWEAFNETYNYFRDLKYKYISENHPTVYSEIK